ncbi:hypothetical protein COCON_G00148390 [Conger conger]|uniref:Uncharacterized protein n=1 Tax=Conger conger TaxID=82655 RepID=A0A9Q1DCP7_CONCO|nr:hypothetical protein COCON_G00148390 [Conger conger]
MEEAYTIANQSSQKAADRSKRYHDSKTQPELAKNDKGKLKERHQSASQTQEFHEDSGDEYELRYEPLRGPTVSAERNETSAATKRETPTKTYDLQSAWYTFLLRCPAGMASQMVPVYHAPGLVPWLPPLQPYYFQPPLMYGLQKT